MYRAAAAATRKTIIYSSVTSMLLDLKLPSFNTVHTQCMSDFNGRSLSVNVRISHTRGLAQQ